MIRSTMATLPDHCGSSAHIKNIIWSVEYRTNTKIKTFIPATEPPDPRRVSEGFLEGSLKGSLKGSSEGISEGFLKGSAEGPFKKPSKRKSPSKTFQEGVEIDDALGFPGVLKSVPGSGSAVAGNESLDTKGNNNIEDMRRLCSKWVDYFHCTLVAKDVTFDVKHSDDYDLLCSKSVVRESWLWSWLSPSRPSSKNQMNMTFV